jgi:cell division protein FtsL
MSRARHPEVGVALNQRLVRERDRSRSRELMRFVFYGAAIALPLLLYVWQRVDFLRVSYRVHALEEQSTALRKSSESLRVQRSFLMNHDRIEDLARRRLGLVDPEPGNERRIVMEGGRFRAASAPMEAGMVPTPALGERER